MSPSPTSWLCVPLPSPSSRTRASLGPLDSMRCVTADDVSTTMRVNDGYDRTLTSSRPTSAAAAANRVVVGPGAALATRVGTTRPTNDCGTSHTPPFTRTGASSTTGLPSTSTCAQLRVSVTTLLPVRSWARVLPAAATTLAGGRPFAWIEAATRVSSTYGRPSWFTVGKGGTAQLVEASTNTIRTPARHLPLIGSQF